MTAVVVPRLYDRHVELQKPPCTTAGRHDRLAGGVRWMLAVRLPPLLPGWGRLVGILLGASQWPLAGRFFLLP